jgi:large subunit ribosomal protein L29
MNKAKQFHEMNDEELNAKVVSLKNELFNLRFQQTVGQLKNPLMLRTVKKDIARALTVIRERQIAAKKGGNK